ncbi:MAG TPA: hypothetical protein VOB72_06490 [Candidatus Dormibacteraeota bacterium]|nr:hypothetical protein [Candidatus Dormibacteraeota bacterium]
MDQLLSAGGLAAPFLVLGAMVAIVVWGRRRGLAGTEVPRRFWFGDLGSGWRQEDGAPPLPPDPPRPFGDDDQAADGGRSNTIPRSGRC